MQPHNQQLLPIAYVSKSLDETQKNYSATKKEALALVFAVEQFRQIILGHETHVHTDHLPLLGALKKPTKDQCLQSWSLLIQDYKIKIHYIEGIKNHMADTLSRLPLKMDTDVIDLNTQFHNDLLERNQQFCNNIQEYIPERVPWTNSKLIKAQENDENCQALIKPFGKDSDIVINNPKIPKDIQINVKILNNVIYVQRNIKRGNIIDQYLVPYIPDSLMPEAFKLIHSDPIAGHNGTERSLKRFVKNFYNINEKKLIDDYCKTCELCIQAKGIPKAVPIKKYPIPSRPFHTIHSDILGPVRITESGHQYILTIRDYTTRYTILVPLKHKTTDEIIHALRIVFSFFGSSNVLVTDNAAEYTSDKLKKFLKNYNCKKVQIAPFHPASQGFSEVINREVNKLLRIYTTQLAIHDWDILLPTIQHCINDTFNSSIGESPFYALFSYDSSSSSLSPPKLSYAEDELTQHLTRTAQIRQHCREHLLKAQAQYTDYTNINRKTKEIQIGSRVYAKIDKHRHTPKNKLDLSISGPFKVLAPLGKAWKLLELSTNKKFTVHPDYIVLRPSVTTNVNPKIPNIDTSDLSSDDEDTPADPKINPSGIKSEKPIIHSKKLNENQLNEPETMTEPPFIRRQPDRACKNKVLTS